MAIINTITNNKGDNVILGDLNLPEVDWEEGTTYSYSGVSSKDRALPLLDSMNKDRYINHVNEPTILRLHDQMKNGDFLHVPVHDVIISNCTNLIQNVSVENGIGNCDRGAVLFEINLIKSVPSLELTYDYRNADWKKVRCTFKEIHSLNKIDSDNPQEFLNNLSSCTVCILITD